MKAEVKDMHPANQGKASVTTMHSDSGAIASICNAAMVGARMAGTSLFTVTVR